VAGDTAIKDAPRVRQPEFDAALAKLWKYFACLGMESDGELMTLNLAPPRRKPRRRRSDCINRGAGLQVCQDGPAAHE